MINAHASFLSLINSGESPNMDSASANDGFAQPLLEFFACVDFGIEHGDGFTFGLGLSQEKVSTGPVLNEANGFIGSVAYAKGPLSARLAYGEAESEVRTSSTANDTNSAKSTDTSFAVSYNLGVAVPYLQYEATKVDVNQIGGTAFNKEFASNATEIGSTFPMGAFTPYVTFGAGELEYAGNGIKTSAYQLGTTYALSKRTYVYGGAGRFKIDTVAETTGYKLGLVHSF